MAETKIGHVYAGICAAYPNWIKIGCTSKPPHERMRELSAASGVPIPFVLAYSRKVNDPFSVESWLHEKLDHCRVNDSREFFQIKLHEAIMLIDTFDEVRDNGAALINTPFADLYATFDQDGPPELSVDEQAACRTLEESLACQA